MIRIILSKIDDIHTLDILDTTKNPASSITRHIDYFEAYAELKKAVRDWSESK